MPKAKKKPSKKQSSFRQCVAGKMEGKTFKDGTAARAAFSKAAKACKMK